MTEATTETSTECVQEGAFTFQVRLGETRLERFYIAMQKKDGSPW